MNREKKSLLIFSKNSDIRTVTVISAGFLVIVVLIQVIGGLFSYGTLEYPTFISPLNLLNILMQVACVGIISMGMTTIMLSGGIDLSVGMMVSLVAIFVAKCIKDWGISVPLALMMGICLPIALESVMGFIISRLNVESFIITLGGMITCRGIALLICKSQEVTLKHNLDFFKYNLIEGATTSQGLNLNVPVYVAVFLLITAVVWAVLKYTKYGRRVYAVGGNPLAAYLSGINVKNIRMTAFIINGLCVGIGALMLLARINSAIITIGQNLEIDVIAAVVIGGVSMSGGKGSSVGAFLGAILMGAIANAMNIMRIQSEWQFFVKGVIIIVAVAGGAISERITLQKAVKRMETGASKASGESFDKAAAG
jgi:ribose/xylose/arabinose/galactoside ABC-type transport system permease subunit